MTVALGMMLLCACVNRPSVPRADPLDSDWADFERSGLAEVRIERRLYMRPGNPHFLIRVRVTNRGDAVLGVDLRDGGTVLYPNQWGGLSEPERGIIDEAFTKPHTLTSELNARLTADYRSGALTMIPVGGSIDYFREFNASGRDDIDGTDSPYLFVSIKGQLLLTDGVRVQNLLPAADSLYLRTPVAWGTVPASARVVPDWWTGVRRRRD